MALIKYGGGIIQMSGSIAGNTYARNRYGNYARARTKPTNPNTDKQQVIRSIMAYLTEKWSTGLTAAQRAAWETYADNVSMLNRLGETVQLSGMNHFIRSNSYRRHFATNWVAAGPVIFELPTKDATMTVTVSEATQQFTLTFDDGLDWCSEDSAFLGVYMGVPQNAQRNFFAGPYQKNWCYWGASGVPITSPQIGDVQFAVSEGQHLWFRFRISRADGRLSEAFRDDCFCAA